MNITDEKLDLPEALKKTTLNANVDEDEDED
jgi:hypothetical protein